MTAGASQIPLNAASHNNQSLFSDHYLNDILRRSEGWRSVIPQAQAFLVWLRNLYTQEKAQLPDYKESQLEDNWLKPIFDRLGHVWEGQAAVPGLKRTAKKPDFVFFPDETARKTAVSYQNSADYATFALAVGEVKQWGINLSKKTGTLPIFDDQNPMFQIDTYLTLTGLEWGILSNGRIWRLLHKASSRTLETYFEIDLPATLEQPDETKATAVAAYFRLFFNQTSFRPDEHGRTFLTAALEQSRAYALALEVDLRDNAYRALEQLILGFFAANADLDAADPSQRAQVYRHSLYLLYRLLFLLYDLRGLPIPRINFNTPQDQCTAVVATAKTHYEQGNHPALLSWTTAELAANRNDTLHDLHAFLAGQMIAMNKEKQAAVEAFWLDLEGVSDAKTFAVLRHKGKQQASLHKAVPAARPFVSAASRSSVALDAGLSWNEEAFKEFVKLLVKKVPHRSDIVQVYRQHTPGVAVLNQRLAATDHLIDQVVYQLYGLTPAEIVLVEGT